MGYWILLILTTLLWFGISWLVFRRIGFFGSHRLPKFRLHQDGRVYDSRKSIYLTDGVENLVHVLHIFVDAEGRPFVYRPKGKQVQLFATYDEFSDFLCQHCGGEGATGLPSLSSINLRFDRCIVPSDV